MQFAPVLIPTLNRHEHLRKCLESLSRCTWADQTEVYVALDYPPSEKYVEGWKINKCFLEKCGDMGFKKLHVIQREENYGTWRPGDKGNARMLYQWIRETHDRYITSEDDNVFSPNFLEFMNKGLEKFENDDSVLCICGFRWFFPIKSNGNTFFRTNVSFTPWGVGYWSKKLMNCPKLDYKWYRQQLSLGNLIKVYKTSGPSYMNALIELSNADKSHSHVIDYHMAVYMILSDLYQIIPVESLVRNIGLDGTGTMPTNDERMQGLYDSIPTSNEKHFEFVGTGYECFDYNQKIYRKERNWHSRRFYFVSFLKKWVRLIKYWK